MSYDGANLSVLAYANGFTQWHYLTPETAVTGGGYFDPAAAQLRAGDLIVVTTAAATAPMTALMRVAAVSKGTVTVAAL